jgi:hypothetical protein
MRSAGFDVVGFNASPWPVVPAPRYISEGYTKVPGRLTVRIRLDHSMGDNIGWAARLKILQDVSLHSLRKQTYQGFHTEVIYPSSLSRADVDDLLRIVDDQAVCLPAKDRWESLSPPRPTIPAEAVSVYVTMAPTVFLNSGTLMQFIESFTAEREWTSTAPSLQINYSMTDPAQWTAMLKGTHPANSGNGLVGVEGWYVSPVKISLPFIDNASLPWIEQRDEILTGDTQAYELPTKDFTTIGMSRKAPPHYKLYRTAPVLATRWKWRIDIDDYGGLPEPYLGLSMDKFRYRTNPALYYVQEPGMSGNNNDPWAVEIKASQIRTVVKVSTFGPGSTSSPACFPVTLSQLQERTDGEGFHLGDVTSLLPDGLHLIRTNRGIGDLRVAWNDDPYVQGGIATVYYNGFTMNFQHGTHKLVLLKSFAQHEKNWAVFPRSFSPSGEQSATVEGANGTYRFAVYSLHPFVLVRLDIESGEVLKISNMTFDPPMLSMSSSSAPIPYVWEGVRGYLMGVHIRASGSTYVHRFLFLSEFGFPLKLSQAFNLLSVDSQAKPLIYVHSLLIATDARGHKNLYIGYGKDDEEAWIACVDVAEISRLHWVPLV